MLSGCLILVAAGDVSGVVKIYNGRAGESLWMKANEGCEATCEYTTDREEADAVVVSTWNGFEKNPIDQRDLVFVSSVQPLGYSKGPFLEPHQVAIAESSDARAFGGANLWHLADFVNITIGYPQASNIQMSFAPANFFDDVLHMPVPKLKDKPNLALWAGRHCGATYDRTGLMQELMEHMNIDSRGGCIPNTDQMPWGVVTDEHKKYKFIFHLENSLDQDYISERFYNSFMANAIPVYYGAPNIQDYSPGEKSFIDMRDFESAKELAAHLKKVAQDEELFQSYFAYRNAAEEPAEALSRAMEFSLQHKEFLCKVCECIKDDNCANVHSGEQLLDDHPDLPEQVTPFPLQSVHNTQEHIRRPANERPSYSINKAKPVAATAFGGGGAVKKAKDVPKPKPIPKPKPMPKPAAKKKEENPKQVKQPTPAVKKTSKEPQANAKPAEQARKLSEDTEQCNFEESLKALLYADPLTTVDLIGDTLSDEQWKFLLHRNMAKLLKLVPPPPPGK